MGCINRSKVYTPSGFPGQKSMSKSHMPKGNDHSVSKTSPCNRSTVNTPQSFPGSKSMNPAKGVLSAKSTSGMINPQGRVGGGKKGFSSGSFRQGPNPIGSGKPSYRPHKGDA